MAYVDKELIVKLKHACIAKYPLSYINGIFALAKEIADMPEADVVEVVRCKDCKWVKKVMIGECENYICKCPWMFERYVRNGFCSYGERKGAE